MRSVKRENLNCTGEREPMDKVLKKKWIKSVAKVEGVASRRARASPELQAG